ncbi:MAG TPA: putative toxin-antitoxin system toxin component, PIN family [Clostridia bacterium]|nr:putative toxin-antitoxin system toxin component, PIN family [Clostridia bacterium]
MVVDTNIFINAIFHGDIYSQRVLQLIADGRIRLLTTERIEDEILQVHILHVLEPRRLSLEQVKRPFLKLLKLLRMAETISAPQVFNACVDPDDNKFFDCAIAGHADYIISMNSDLGTASKVAVPVLSPWQFLQEAIEVSGR